MPVKNNNRPDRGKNRKAGNAPELSAGQERANLARQLGIKQKTKDVIDEMLEKPNELPRDIYMKHHKTTNKNTASTAMNKLLKKPSVIGYRDAAVGKAKRRIVSLVDSTNESIALKAADSIIDRNEGKAVQKTENTSRTVRVSLDLSGLRLGSHYIKPEQLEPQT